MSLKYKLPTILTGMAVVLMPLKYSPDDISIHNNIHTHHATHAPDALRVHFDEQVYNMKQPRLTANLDELFGPRVVETKAIRNGVQYILSNGDCVERRGGTLAWRNNNPGCIRYSAHAVELGATGKANGFAVFPDEETGMRAVATLLQSKDYCNLTIGAAIAKYAPPHENNTDAYIKEVCWMTGLSRKLTIRNLNNEQMMRVVDAIRTIEGWRVGTETKTSAPTNEYAAQYSRAVQTQRGILSAKSQHAI